MKRFMGKAMPRSTNVHRDSCLCPLSTFFLRCFLREFVAILTESKLKSNLDRRFFFQNAKKWLKF